MALTLLFFLATSACAPIETVTDAGSLPLWARMESGPGAEIRPEPGQPYAVVFGTLGSSGTDYEMTNRRVVVRRAGGGPGTDIRASFTRTGLDRVVGTPAEVTYQ